MVPTSTMERAMILDYLLSLIFMDWEVGRQHED